MGTINIFYISGGTIKIKVAENSSLLIITHLDGFKFHFYDTDLSPTEIS